ncbi:hypothetical protein A3L09_08595 [Thermococcus profundus]|uniref:Class III signal peptide-containing protein n=2 Tax=Thermococcus profundus TaxID=49899 RepID=A0A2Z2M9S3_THEPR|nr:hypothetical protein A3L09_08595 [Thermococcus profundus]
MGKRGQVSLEFMFVFALMLVLLVYSVKNTTFDQGTVSADTLRVQIALEEKNLANAISNTINQVYSQGPGSKATTYIRLSYLRDPAYLEKVWNVKNPKVFITYGQLPGGPSGNGTYITVTGTGFNLVLSGGDKNVLWSRSMYQAILYGNQSVWSPRGSVSLGSSTVYGLEIDPTNLPVTLKIVVEWNPDSPDSWTFNSAKGELRINISPGE